MLTQDASGDGFTQYAAMLAALAEHEAKGNVTVYKQIWNEPDLTSYFNYSAGGTTFFQDVGRQSRRKKTAGGWRRRRTLEIHTEN